MKTPDEIKKALECCSTKKPCPSCPMWDECKEAASLKPLWDNALAYIQQLEQERDAAVKVVKATTYSCEYCKHHESGGCDSTPLPYAECFEWLGVKEE